MDKTSLAIGIAYDGVTQEAGNKYRQAFENLINTLLQYPSLPLTLCFYTEGVRWVTKESPFIEQLKEIRARGADILVCRETVRSAGLGGQLAVGRMDSPDHIDDVLLHAQHAMVL